MKFVIFIYKFFSNFEKVQVTKYQNTSFHNDIIYYNLLNYNKNI